MRTRESVTRTDITKKALHPTLINFIKGKHKPHTNRLIMFSRYEAVRNKQIEIT